MVRFKVAKPLQNNQSIFNEFNYLNYENMGPNCVGSACTKNCYGGLQTILSKIIVL